VKAGSGITPLGVPCMIGIYLSTQRALGMLDGLGGSVNKEQFDSHYKFEYDKFFKLLAHIGDSLNGRKDRFDKADLIEAGVAVATRNRMRWVDELGYDLEDPERGFKFECKSQKNVFFTAKGGKLRKSGKTSKIKLTNTLQQSAKKNLEVTADYLLLVDSGHLMMGILPYEDVVTKYSRELKDGFECEIPLKEITILYGEPHRTITFEGPSTSYKQEKMRLLEQYVGGFFTNEN